MYNNIFSPVCDLQTAGLSSEWGIYDKWYIYLMGVTDADIVQFYYHPKCQTINNTQNPAGQKPQAEFNCNIHGIRYWRAFDF